MSDSAPELHRHFGLSTATYVVIASMVGVGILTTSGYIVQSTGSHPWMLALWLVGGILALCGALSVAELAAAMPRAGGEYVFMHEAYGPLAAFLYGWISFLIGFSAPTAISAYASARYLLGAFGDAGELELAARAIAAVIILVFTLVHLLGSGPSARAQNLTTMAKIAVLALFAAGGLIFGRGSFTHVGAATDAHVSFGVLGISLVYVMFSYTGWNAATYLAGEVRDAPRTLPRAILLGCSSVLVLYLVLNVVYAYALPVHEVRALTHAQLDAIAATVAERLFGPWVSRPLSGAIGVGLLASVSAFILTGPRVYYAMARSGHFPAAAGRVTTAGVPAVAILSQAGCALLFLITGSFKNILTYAGVGLSLSAFFVILSLFVLRVRRPEMPRPFRTPGYPVVPLLFLLSIAWMIVFAFRNEPFWSSVSIGSILLGAPLYWLWQQSATRV